MVPATFGPDGLKVMHHFMEEFFSLPPDDPVVFLTVVSSIGNFSLSGNGPIAVPTLLPARLASLVGGELEKHPTLALQRPS